MKKKVLYIGNQQTQSSKATLTTIDTLSKNLKGEGFHVISASGKKNKILRLLDMLFTVLINRKNTVSVLIDTYSTQNFWYAVAVGNLCRLLHLPYIPILHGGNLPERLQKNPFQSKKFFHGAKACVAPSHYLLNAFKEQGYTNVVFIPNSIEIDKYPLKKRESILPKLLWVRSFAEIYNPLLALKVIERVIEIYPMATLCMVGPDKDGSLQLCKAYAQRKKLPVMFTGKLPKEEWLQLSQSYDIFINTTLFDNTPVSVIEAMALGLPVISSKVGGIPYLLEHKENALLVASNDQEAFVEAIIFLCYHTSEVKAITKNARTKVEQFDWQKVKQHWLTLLGE
ncbi:MAG: glycosyltransferase family 4 protein [Flavobacteriaceae bacterium]